LRLNYILNIEMNSSSKKSNNGATAPKISRSLNNSQAEYGNERPLNAVVVNIEPAPKPKSLLNSFTGAVESIGTSVGKVAGNTVGAVTGVTGSAVGAVGSAASGMLGAFTGKPGATAPRQPGQMGGYYAGSYPVSGNPSSGDPYLAEYYSVTTGGGYMRKNKNSRRKQKQMARSTRRASRRSRRASRKSRRVGGRRQNGNNNNQVDSKKKRRRKRNKKRLKSYLSSSSPSGGEENERVQVSGMFMAGVGGVGGAG
jgi:hypothetical protein